VSSDEESAPPLPTGPRAADVVWEREAWPLFDDFLRRWDHGLARLVDERRARLYHEASTPRVVVERTRPIVPTLTVSEVQPPPDVYTTLSHRAPQALLRDLHRPVKGFAFVIPERLEGTERPSLLEVWRETRRAHTGRDPMPRIEPLLRVVREELARRRAFLENLWRPYMPDDAPRQPRQGY
jgi:hypothetical protein